MKQREIKECEICDKPMWRSFSVGQGKVLHTCKKHFDVVFATARSYADLYAE